ncbi:type II secretion system F family protein [Paraburkholderia phenoliruptrix]|uniref:type II secretion system F family protein n=1 Tax=Paraburkholderia phenoliruptrix TaxID=252970 RepID=UPI0028698B66|nr:type II secretion system F family protein [Paraburkholderia phenoliruptrix]WMY06834.1 type II secretion system F family protein [Paraburkholderia phenoliruptrix]
MSSAALIVAALALLCAALALFILQRGAQRKEQVSAERFIDSRMSAAQSAAPTAAMGGSSGVAAGGAFTANAGGPAGAMSATGVSSVSGAARGAAASAASPGAALGAASASARRAAPAVSLAPQAPAADAGWYAYLRYLGARARYACGAMLNRAGLRNARGTIVAVAAIVVVLCLVAASQGGVLAAGVTLCGCAVFLYFVTSMRASRRRQAIVRQLPSFLDGIVRLITLGNSVPAAFQASLQITEAPLRECLDHVSRMLRSGVEIDRALSHVAVLYGARELELVGAVLRLSVKYGGRADVMLDRMSSFMRDLEHAERELVAMSSETRLSSWVLGMLPVGIGGFLILTNPRYFGAMWFDPGGRQILYIAFALQLTGAYLLYRLARLKA